MSIKIRTHIHIVIVVGHTIKFIEKISFNFHFYGSPKIKKTKKNIHLYIYIDWLRWMRTFVLFGRGGKMLFGHSYRAKSRKKQVSDEIEERQAWENKKENGRKKKRKKTASIFSLVILSVLCEWQIWKFMCVSSKHAVAHRLMFDHWWYSIWLWVCLAFEKSLALFFTPSLSHSLHMCVLASCIAFIIPQKSHHSKILWTCVCAAFGSAGCCSK